MVGQQIENGGEPALLLGAHQSAMAAALAAITTRDVSATARRQLLGSDQRLIQLKAIAARLDRGFADGVAGGRGVFARLASREQAQFLRAGALIAARIHQLDGLRQPARAALARASRLRRAAPAGAPIPIAKEEISMKTDQLRAVFGKLNDMAFDVARLDATAAWKLGSELATSIRDRQMLGLEENLRDDFRRVAGLLGFVLASTGAESPAP